MTIPKFKIALDALGGDYAPLNEINGAYQLLNDSVHQDVDLYLVGQENNIKNAIKEQGYNPDLVKYINAEERVNMDDDPLEVLKKKKNSSIYVGISKLKEGDVDAFVSAGNTGAMLAVSTMILGRINGVSRPTIGSFFPTITDYPVLVLDVGATVDLKPRYLYEYAIMGSIYVEKMLNISRPRIGLLNVGEEETKGTDQIKETYNLLKNSSLNFVGNVEGRDIFSANADVIVCDGFVGNIVLKFAESFLTILKSKLKQYSKKNLVNKLKTGLVVPILKDILQQFDYQSYGGVPLLGVNGVSIIGHGKSTPLAIKNMLIRAKEIIQKDINKQIEKTLTNLEN
jgi:glycerol-3-phosphate acyltransferase PlsX